MNMDQEKQGEESEETQVEKHGSDGKSSAKPLEELIDQPVRPMPARAESSGDIV